MTEDLLLILTVDSMTEACSFYKDAEGPLVKKYMPLIGKVTRMDIRNTQVERRIDRANFYTRLKPYFLIS
jgi:hypothetical protein